MRGHSVPSGIVSCCWIPHRASQVTCSAVICGAEVLLVVPLACRHDPCVMGDLTPGWTADHAGPGDRGGEGLKLFWCVLADC